MTVASSNENHQENRESPLSNVSLDNFKVKKQKTDFFILGISYCFDKYDIPPPPIAKVDEALDDLDVKKTPTKS